MLVLLAASFAPLRCSLLGERDVEEAQITAVYDALRMLLSHLSKRQNHMTR